MHYMISSKKPLVSFSTKGFYLYFEVKGFNIPFHAMLYKADRDKR